MPDLEKLDPEEIVRTARRLRNRVWERFPDAGLVAVAEQLVELATRANATCRQIRSPDLRLRITSYSVIGVLLVAAIATLVIALSGGASHGPPSLPELVQAIEAGINDFVLLGAAIYFVVSFESRSKRGRILRALQDLRTLSHLIDVHQLTKTPEVLGHEAPTASSPDRKLSPAQLGRYLDYCSEMLSITGKIAALYADGFEDAQSVEAVTEVEELTIGLQTKIWQKLILLRMSATPEALAPVLPSVPAPRTELAAQSD